MVKNTNKSRKKKEEINGKSRNTKNTKLLFRI